MQKGYERLTEPGGMKYNRRLKQGITRWEATQRLAELEDLLEQRAAEMDAFNLSPGQLMTLEECFAEGGAR